MPVLFALLQAPQERVQASALGAIQGVCFVPSGRHHIRSCRQVYFFIHDRYDDLNRCAFFIEKFFVIILYISRLLYNYCSEYRATVRSHACKGRCCSSQSIGLGSQPERGHPEHSHHIR